MSRPDALVYAVRPRVVGHYLGQLGIVLALLGIPPVLVAVFTAHWREGAIQAGVSVLAGLAGWLLSRRQATEEIQTNEALVIIASGFFVASLMAAVSMAASGLTPVDAFFEAVSGVTTTGLTVLAAPEEASPVLIFNRAWAQWYGGLGFVTLASAVLARGHLVNRVAGLEPEDDDLVGGMRAHTRRVLKVYLTLTAVGIVALALLGTGAWDAVLYTLASVSTGGFSPYAESVEILSIPSRAVVMGLCVLGAVSFVTLHASVRDSWRKALDDPQLRSLLLAGTAAALLLWLLKADTTTGALTGGFLERWGHVLFTAFSAQTTAGFSTVSPADLPGAGKLVLMAAMFVGGSAASTAGGIKQVRFLVAFGVLRRRVVQTALPRHAVHVARIAGEKIEPEDTERMLGLILGFVGMIGVVWLTFAAYGYPPTDALFDIVSAAGTVGLSTGVVSAGLEAPLKISLAVAMLVGRLELIAVLVFLAPGTWLGRRRAGS